MRIKRVKMQTEWRKKRNRRIYGAIIGAILLPTAFWGVIFLIKAYGPIIALVFPTIALGWLGAWIVGLFTLPKDEQ